MTQISVRVDEQVKALAEQVCDEIGISMSAAITIFLKKLGREKRIPFEVSVDPFYSEENIARLRAAMLDTNSPIVKTMADLEVLEDD